MLRGDWLTDGPAVEEFERRVAEYTGAAHAVAFNSATVGACTARAFAAGLGPGDIVHTTSAHLHGQRQLRPVRRRHAPP